METDAMLTSGECGSTAYFFLVGTEVLDNKRKDLSLIRHIATNIASQHLRI